MTTGYTRQSAANIVPGAGIQSAHLNAEFNAILAALHASTGHTHDGTTGAGAPVQSKIVRNAQTAAYTVVSTDLGTTVDVTSASPVTVSLLAAASAGAGFHVYVRNSGTATVTVDPNGAELVNAAATLAVPASSTVHLYCNGSAWYGLTTLPAAVTGGDFTTLVRLIGGYREYAVARANTGSATTLTSANLQLYTLNANTTLTLPTLAESTGDVTTLVIDLVQDGTGGRTVTWAPPAGQTLRWHASTAPTINATAGKVNQFVFVKKQGDSWWTGALILKE